MRRTKNILAAGFLAGLLIALIFATTTSVTAKAGESGETAEKENATENALVPAIPGTFLTGPNEGDPLSIALSFIRANRASLEMSEDEVSSLLVKDQYLSQKSGITHIYFIQTHNGIEGYNSIINANIASDGSIISVGNRVVPNLTAAIQDDGLQISAVEAVENAAGHLRLELNEVPVVEEVIGGAAQAVVISNSGISQDAIPARLVYQPMADGSVRLAWDLIIHELTGYNWWNIRVDAATGAELDKNNFFVNDNFGAHVDHYGESAGPASAGQAQLGVTQVPSSYLVYAPPVESPNYGVPAPPADARTTEIAPWLDAPSNPSPLGWHDSGATSWTNTQGNNVDSHKGSTRFDCGVDLECDPPLDLTQEPTTAGNVNVATVNLFYWNNIIHDITYEFGFDEAAGNFQINNFGNGGLGNDRVNANAQAPGNCNANFGTPADGSQPTMNMFVCNIATPSRDGDLDNGVIAHEYGHGISNRLTGGPSNVGCLNNSEQMGEGWSDWIGLMLSIEPGDAGEDPRGIGTWLLGQGPNGAGVRTQLYSTDMAINTHTYNSINGMAIPHGVGEVWATLVWEMVWAMIDEYGYNPDFYGDWSTGGNNLAFQLVMDGMKLQPCSPGFVDGRDGILLADQNLTGGANQCMIWEAFAKRGLGFSADQGSSGSTSDGTEGYDIPPFCEFLGVAPASVDICVGDTAEFEITLGNAFTPNINFTVDGNPATTSASFSPNPVTTVPSTTTLTIANTGAAAAGSYTMTITGTDSLAISSTIPVVLGVFDANPGNINLTSPPDTAVNVLRQPTFVWSSATQAATYYLEVDDDPGFGSLEYSATVNGTSHTANVSLGSLTTYYWRVTASNPCGDGASSAVFSFTTEPIPPILLVDDDDNGPDVRSYYTDALDALFLDYDIWDTNNSDNEPSFGFMSAYQMIIWFTGDEFGGAAGPSSASEAQLGNWLDAGNCLFMSSQDYRYDRGQTAFMSNYLGVATSSNDNGDYSSVLATGPVVGGLGSFALNYPFTDYSDIVNPSASASLAFEGNNGNNAAVNKDSGVYRTIFTSFPWEAIADPNGRLDVMDAIVNWCGVGAARGTLDGTVTDDGTASGINNATITVDDGISLQTGTTNGSGDYSMLLSPGTYTVTASATGYFSETVGGVTIVTETVTTQDFALVAMVGTLDHTGGTIEDSAIMGNTVTNTIMVSNTGTVPFTFSTAMGAGWASASPTGGTLNPGESMAMDIVFDSTVTAGDGTYSTTMSFSGDYDNSPAPVDLVFHVLPGMTDVYMPAVMGDGGGPAAPTAALPWLLPLLGITAVAGFSITRSRFRSFFRSGK